MQSVEELAELPVMNNGASRPLLGDVAQMKTGTAMGLVERYNMQRVVSITANPHALPIGALEGAINKAIAAAGKPPAGVNVAVRGQIPPLKETLDGLQGGLLLAVAAIFLLLAACFQSLRLSLAILAMVPAVWCGAALALAWTGTTLNIQSYLGAIMATGIAVANAILLVTFAEAARGPLHGRDAAREAGVGRVRAVLMTAFAMIAGMVPLAMGDASTAPLGRAVIGGLIAATIATLTVLPALYTILQPGAAAHSVSLDPDDPASRYYESVA
jgi:multidrug efflux pump subunit AcrB